MTYEWEPKYRDERNKLIDGEFDYAKSYDKYVLTLSGGALALSITFIHDIVGEGPVRGPLLAVLAWLSFALSVGAALVSIQQSGPLYRSFRDILDRKAERAGDGFAFTEVRAEQSRCHRLILMDCLNYGSLVLFLLGTILLLSFTACNLGDKAMSKSDLVGKADQSGSLPCGAKPPLAEVAVLPAQPLTEGMKPAFAPVDVAPPSTPPPSPDPGGNQPVGTTEPASQPSQGQPSGG